MANRSNDSGTASITGSGRYWSWFLVIAAFLIVVLFLWMRADRDRQLADWRSRLESVAEDRRRMVELWISERFGDGHLWSVFPSVREVAARHAAGAMPDADPAHGHLAEVLTHAAEAHGYAAIHLLDSRSESLVASARAEPIGDACRPLVVDALRDHRQLMGLHLHGRAPWIGIATPVDDAAGRALAVVYAEIDPQRSLYPLLIHEPVPTLTGDSFLLRHAASGTVLLSPRRVPASPQVLQTLPPAAVRLASDLALAHESFGLFTDGNGERILAATRRVESNDWLLVILVNESEALLPHRKLAYITTLAVAALLAVLFGAFTYIRRAAIARADALERLDFERQRAAEARAASQLAHERAGELRLLETIAKGAPLAKTLAALVHFVEEQQPGLLASVLLVENGTLRHAVAPSLPETYCAAIDGIAVAEGSGSCGTAAFRGSRVVVSEIATDPLWADLAGLARAHGLAACWSHPIRLADGSVSGTFALYRREPGSPTEREIGLVERATHIAAIAIDRGRVAAELESSLAELHAIFDSTTIGMTLIDPSGRPVKVNPALEQFLGYSAEEVRERHFSEFTHPEDRAEGLALYSQLLSGARDSYQTEKRYLRKNGQVVWGRLTVSLVKGSEKSAGFAIGLVEDFTDRRLLQAELQQAGKMEAVGRLAGGIAHDFNNILNVILGCGELALAELQSAPETRRLVEEILASADRAAVLTRQLLAFSRKQTLETRVLDTGVVVQEMAQLLRRVLGEDVEIVVSCQPGVARIRADRGQLEQVLMNLAVNSRDAMLAGGRLEIETVAMELDDAFVALHPGSRPGPHVRLSVADNGSGMTREVLARVFEPFFTTKEASKGTGLGLATVYGIVKQSHGYITVESAPERGTRFDIYLPQVDEPVAAAPAAPPPLERGHESILVVEDEPSLRKLLQTMLATMGYDVRVAPSAPAAVEMCALDPATLPVDLLLTDIVMPEMNGREVARRIRELRPEVKVLYMSGYTGDVLLQHGELEGDASMIAKPFSRDALASKVREALR